MTEHRVQIALPVHAVHQAWRRYVGYGGSENDGDNLTWSADDGSGLIANFTSEGPEVTTLTTARGGSSDAVGTDADLSDFVEGFVSYINSAYDELHEDPGEQAGNAPVGPDGTAHMAEQPRRLGTDNLGTDTPAVDPNGLR